MTRLILILLFAPLVVSAESTRNTEHTLKLNPADNSTPAKLADAAAVLEGHWEGEALGGQAEEIWSSPKGGAMMGMFRSMKDGKPGFYEFFLLKEEAGTLVLQLKHFTPDLTGWEEKDKFVTFRFIKAEPGRLYFDGLTYERKDDSLRVWVVAKKKDGSLSELHFNYSRVRP